MQRRFIMVNLSEKCMQLVSDGSLCAILIDVHNVFLSRTKNVFRLHFDVGVTAHMLV